MKKSTESSSESSGSDDLIIDNLDNFTFDSIKDFGLNKQLDQSFFDNMIRTYLEKNDHGLYQTLKTLNDADTTDGSRGSKEKYLKLYLTAIKNNINRLKKNSRSIPLMMGRIALFFTVIIVLPYFLRKEFPTYPGSTLLVSMLFISLFSCLVFADMIVCMQTDAEEYDNRRDLIKLLEHLDTSYIKMDHKQHSIEVPTCRGEFDIAFNYACLLEEQCPSNFTGNPGCLIIFTKDMLTRCRDLSHISYENPPLPRSHCTDLLYHLFYDDSLSDNIDLENLEIISDNELQLLT